MAYKEQLIILALAISDKKTQQGTINKIISELKNYKDVIDKKISEL